ncbi:MAG: PKD domain-containing protein [Chitinophagaceae bacterium]
MRKILLGFILLFGAFTAGAQCSASFIATNNPTGNNLLNVDFTNTSSYSIPFTGQKNTVYGYYGDGGTFNNTSGTTIPSHVYATPGIYTISVIILTKDSVTNTLICKDSVAMNDTVNYTPCGNKIFVAGSGATKNFTSTIPAGGTGVSYSWTFGDGGTATTANPSHTYSSAGFYTVTLTTTIGACSYTNVLGIYVSIPPPALNCSTLAANFTSAVSANVASFTNTSTTIASTQYYTVASWSYGDGGVATGFNTPPHTYTAPGVYFVKLKMQWRDSLGTTSCRDSITKTVSITTIPTPTNLISGNVFYDTSFGTNFFSVYLIQYDSASNALHAIDSQVTASVTVPYYAFSDYPSGQYRVKAAVWIGSTNGANIVPTYHDSSAYWANASVINHNGAGSINNNIYMRSGTVSGTGTGFIGGNVALGANKGAAAGVEGQLVFLRDKNMKIIGSHNTDASGNYLFSNLPMGYYSIYPELINYTTVPVTPILLNTVHPFYADINFNKDEAKRSLAPRNTGIRYTGENENAIVVSPNPAHNTISIAWHSLENVNGAFIITTITGQEVLRTEAVRGQDGQLNLNVSQLAKGMYFVHGTGSLSGSSSKLILQ